MHQAKHIPTIALSATLDEVQDKLTEASTQFVAVYDGLHFKGVLTANDIYRVFDSYRKTAIVRSHLRLNFTKKGYSCSLYPFFYAIISCGPLSVSPDFP